MLIHFSNIKNEIGPIDGVIHIGAHHAEEAQTYAEYGIKKAFWLEANDELYDVIVDASRRAGLETAGAIGYAISNVDGQDVELNITNDTQASSILGCDPLKNFYPHINVVEKKLVKTRTIASIFEEQDVNINDYQFVNIDIQGAELLALQGFGDLLHSLSIKGIYLEVNYEELYKGCAIVDEIDAYLAKFGFYRKMTCPTGRSWGDALYVRKPNADVSLVYSNSTHRGPGVVASNLIKGLEDFRSLSPTSKNVGLLQLVSNYQDLPGTTLVGPNVMVLPPDMPELVQKFQRFVVPSRWTKRLYSSFEEMKDKKIGIWAVGIDTLKWKPTTAFNEKELDCFIYFKNRSPKELATIQHLLTRFGYSHKTLSYGSYTEAELMETCEKSKFCVLLDGTESQGLAVMQIMSMNVPLVVFDKPTWEGLTRSGTAVTCPATSIPYFESKCGLIAPNHITAETFAGLRETLAGRKPREMILEEHTLHKAAAEYLNFFVGVQR